MLYTEEFPIEDVPTNSIKGYSGNCCFIYEPNINTLHIYKGTLSSAFELEDGSAWNINNYDIKHIVFEDNVTIPNQLFKGFKSVESVEFLNGAVIGMEAFADCTNLKTLNLGLATSIQAQAFSGCTSVDTIVIPNTVTVLGVKAFYNCTSATGIIVGDGVTKINNSCFANCFSVNEVVIGSGVTNIGDNAFENCTKIPFVTIPNSVTTIGAYAFYKCLSVEKITLGNSLAKIGDYAFYRCVNCYELNINSSIMPLASDLYTVYHIEYYCNLNPITPGLGVPYKAKYNMFKDLGENTTGITVNVGNNVDKMSIYYMAGQVDMLKSVNIGSSVSGVAYSRTDNTQVDYSKMFTSQFVGNNHLDSINVSESNPNFSSDGEAIYSKDKTVLYAVAPGVETFEVPLSVKTIGKYAFAGNNNIKKVTFEGNNVSVIEQSAFMNCSRLKYLTLPNSLQSIGSYAFSGCESLKVLDIPRGILVIHNNAFEKCEKLSSVLLPESLTTIEAYAFSGCISLAGIVIPNSTTELCQGAFNNCTSLEEAYIGAQSVKFVSSQYDKTHIFENCSALTIFTLAGSDTSVYASLCSIPCREYTDEDTFADLMAMKLDVYSGYLGFCSDGHGDVEWLTVYDADCENDGYLIGVCEYCSEILDEKHISATGHNYVETRVEPTATTDGVIVDTCSKCGKSKCQVLLATEGEIHEMHQVSGTVVIASDKEATIGRNTAIGADIIINGYTVATTDQNGQYSFNIESGAYEATIHYAYGFDRTVYFVVSDHDLQCNSVAIIGCDWNKDGRVDNKDYIMFKLIFNSYVGTPSYLDYVDMNHDGYINIRDMVIIERCMGISQSDFAYLPTVFK